MGIRAAREFEKGLRLSNAAPTDEQLIARCRNRDADAFATVVSRYETMLTRHCARIVGSSAAEDAVQEAFVSAWLALGSGAEVHDLKPWLFQIARRKAFRTRDVRETTELSDSVPGARSSEEEATGAAQARAVLAAVAALPPTQRDALVGSALHGRSGLQLARQLGTTAPNVRQLVFHARERVRLAAAACVAPPLALLRFLRHQAAGGSAATPGSMAAATALKAGVALVAVVAAGTAAGLQLSQPPSRPPAQHDSLRVDTPAVEVTKSAERAYTRGQLSLQGTTNVSAIAGARRRPGRRNSHGAAGRTSGQQIAALRENTTASVPSSDASPKPRDGLVATTIGGPGGTGTQAKRLLGATTGASLGGVHSVLPSATGLLKTLPADASKLTSKLVAPVVGATGATGSAGATTVQSVTGAVTGAVSPLGATGPTQVVGAVTGAVSSTAQSTVSTVTNTLPIGSH
ncbi:MAG TPA: RNA polymerase sigma factor [Solirubrobacteraceae bacterium]|nr:RNA polymerase sigma factor [Solirubrobacteraceae bacterium]